jgi:glucose/arabinose dehydrogenase
MLVKRSARLAAIVFAAALAGCATASKIIEEAAGALGDPCVPVETRSPMAEGQEPAFPGQTRTCGVKSDVAFQVDVIARGLEKPWAVEPLPGGDLLVTEKPGRMRIISQAGAISAPIAGLPAVAARDQGGLLDVAISPNFSSDRTIYWSYSEPRLGGNGTSVARGVLSSDRTRLTDVRVIFRALPTYTNAMHFGSRVLVGPDGLLYITLGERSDTPMRRYAQDLNAHLGKIVRIRTDGSVPGDNPFAGRSDARPEIWTLGHRNIQAAAFDPQGRLWDIEHGTNGGDELNLIERGKNYGWPIQAYGEEYNGQAIPGASTNPAGFQQPVYFWDPVIAPSGAQFYTGNAFPQWQGSLFVGSLKEKRLVRLTIANNRVTGEEHLLTDRGQRVRDVRQGADGALYLVTDETNGELWRVTPRR